MSGDAPIEGSGAVLTQVRGHTLLVTINRPQARNAVDLEVALGLGDALERADREPEIRTVVLTGAGDRAFCAGADLKAVAAGQLSSDSDERLARWGFACYVHHTISKPTIAAVNGFALGGGTEIALASDLVVAAETATFGLPEVKRGVVAGAGGTFRLPRQIPPKIALEAMLTGRPIAADRAATLGLVNMVVPDREVVQAALDLAATINDNAPLAVQASKRLALGIEDGQVPGEQADWARSTREAQALRHTDDFSEGPRAFAEKRMPRWTGR